MLSNISTFLGRPTVNRDVDADWREFEENFRISLPWDYKDFISSYGPGRVRNNVIFFHPKSPMESGSLSLEREIQRTAKSYLDTRSIDPSLVPWPIYPEPSWVVPIARESRGSQFLLRRSLVEGGSYSLIFDWHFGWDEYQMSFTDFMIKGLSATLDPPVFPAEDGEYPAFVSVGRIEE
ncbi:SMI1/KNR4 family protein [Embleya sp. NBC_00896]|uniref:SMI1/KNR4 family protein n=1 Tax=Embleya sp. NBC_00896 TaxID=2975961 RepID=UPI00386827B7|nr:SMI1/KNR4 family protein [Embleya sp. NBC_00896]